MLTWDTMVLSFTSCLEIVTSYEKMGKMVVAMKQIKFYHENIQLAFYKIDQLRENGEDGSSYEKIKFIS